jgi:phosphoglycolate phosphatase
MQAFFFDLDGTLTDSQAGIVDCYRAALKAVGAPEASGDDLTRQVGAPLPVMLRALKPGIADAEIERGIAAYRAAYERAGIFKNTLYPGVRAMLEIVRDTRRQSWIVTSKPAHYAEQVVDILRIRDLLDGVVGPGLDEHGGKLELIRRALTAAKLAPAQATMLGDRHYDVTGALQAGVAPVGALWGYGAREELSAAGCRDFAASAEDFSRRYAA